MKHANTFRSVAAIGAVLLACGTLAACGDDDGGDAETGQENPTEVSVSDAWARSGTAGGNSAVYMEITGGTEQSDLVAASVSSDVASEAQIHETTGAGGMAEDDGSTDEMSGDEMSGDDMGDMSGDEMSGDDSEGEVTTQGSDEMDEDGSDGMDSDMDHGDGMMSMQEVSAIAIPAGGTIALEPGGFHIMLLELTEDLSTGDSIEVTLSFENGYEETVTAEVRDS